MEKSAISPEMTQMNMFYLNVDNRLCVTLIGSWVAVTLPRALKAWRLNFQKSCLSNKTPQKNQFC